MGEDSNLSIYQYILKMFNENPYLPYVFQNENIAGKSDVLYAIFNDSMYLEDKKAQSKILTDELIECVKNNIITDKMISILDSTPLYMYFKVANDRIGLIISEKIIDPYILYTIAMNMVTESHNVQIVKLGILILGYFQNDIVVKLFKSLGLHSEFTLYVVEALKNVGNNKLLFYLLKNTVGYGKFSVQFQFNPILNEYKQFYFEYGCKNKILPNASAICCLNNPDMQDLYDNLDITLSNYSTLSYLLAYSGENKDLYKIYSSSYLIKKYILLSDRFAKTFLDLAALCVVKINIQNYILSGEINNKYDIDCLNELLIKCKNILTMNVWHNILNDEFNYPTQSTSMIILVMKELNITPSMFLLKNVLSRDPFDINIMEFLLIDNGIKYAKDVICYLDIVIPRNIYDKELMIIEVDEIDKTYVPDLWVLYLIKACNENYIYDEELLLKYIYGRLPDVRREAIKGLNIFRHKWSKDVVDKLKNLYSIEPVINIKQKIKRILKISDNNVIKEQRYVDISHSKCIISKNDIYVMTTKIAGIYYHDIISVKSNVKKGSMLFLVRESYNQHDCNAILVTDEDGYVVGHVPKVCNELVAYMIDKGEKLYAILNDDLKQNGKSSIHIFVCRYSNIISLNKICNETKKEN